MTEMATITQEELNSLLDSEAKLNALENGGVDNWTHYGDALEEYRKQKQKQELRSEYQKQAKEVRDEICEILALAVEEPAGPGAGLGFDLAAQDKVTDIIIDILIEERI